MGNNASISPEVGSAYAVPAEENPIIPEPIVDNVENNYAAVQSPVYSQRKTVRMQDNYNNYSTQNVTDEADEDPVDVLFQFIPFYGQGDPANDGLVRSTLSALSVDEIDRRDSYGNSLLLLACQYGCEDLVRIMLNKGADANAINSSGASGLHFACYSGTSSRAIAKLLLQNGANPDVSESTYGCTPLHYCSGTGDIEFCKLLLSYNAQVHLMDYYNYTCADYARDAGFADVQSFLMGKIKTWEQQQNVRSASTQDLLSLKKSSSNVLTPPPKSTRNSIPPEWNAQYDANTKATYYSNAVTGEVLWEEQLLSRLSLDSQSLKTPTLGVITEAAVPSSASVEKASRVRLTEFLNQNDPSRLPEVDRLLLQYKGSEDEMLRDLCTRYKVDISNELVKFNEKLREIAASEPVQQMQTPLPTVNSSFQLGKGSVTPSNRTAAYSNNNNNIDALQLQQQLQQRTSILETQFEEERAIYRKTISEKEGLIAKLESTLESLQKDRKSLEDDKAALEQSMSKSRAMGGDALRIADEKYSTLQNDYDKIKKELEQTKSELIVEKDKLLSLQNTISNLESGQSDRIMQEQKAAEERARVQREREEAHASELREVENKMKTQEKKYKGELETLKVQSENTETELRKTHDQYKRAKESEISSMNSEAAERKAKFAQELSAAHLRSEEALKRAEQAENMQRQMQKDIEEARQIQQFNAQLHKDLAREQAARKRLHNEMEDLKGRIRVYVRIRPISKSEQEKNCNEAVIRDGKLSVLVKTNDGKKIFDFDQVFAGVENNTQTDIFRDTKHLMMSVIDGYNVCIFAYGQTGAGKSYTMIGAADIGNCLFGDGEFDDKAGITPRAVSELFRLLKERTAQLTYVVEVQMFQLYRDAIEDLLADRNSNGKKKSKDEEIMSLQPLKITLAEHSPTGLVYVEGAAVCIAESPMDVMKIFAKGASRRTTASTQMNAESSRSHLICSLTVKLTNRRTGTASIGKLTLVDLAGSERVDKSGASGEQLKEAQSINKSLSALGDVIAALTSNAKHVPYRNHPLTMLMSDSLGGNSKTLMFVNTSPVDYNVQETISSLNFATRCKDITNSVSSGPGVQAAQVSALKKELAKLKKGGGGPAERSAPAAAPPGGLARPGTTATKRAGPKDEEDEVGPYEND